MFIAFTLLLTFGLSDTVLTGIVQSSIEVFENARSMSISPIGNIYCVDQKRNMVYKISADGSILQSVGGQGWGNGEFYSPTDVSSLFLLEVFVTDYINRRIQRFDKNLNYIQTYDETTLPQSIGKIQPLVCTSSKKGDLFIVDEDGKRIVKINRRNQLEREFGSYKEGIGALIQPKDISITQSDEIVVLDKEKILFYDNFGNYLWKISVAGSEWKSLQCSPDKIILTSTDAVQFITYDGSVRYKLTKNNIIGLPAGSVLVDAAWHDNYLFILTSVGLYRCTVQ